MPSRLRYLALVCGALVLAPACAIAAQPHIFFSDLESGPNTGGENNAGVYVTVFGKGFGAARGNSFVTVGGGQAASYPVWTSARITFQLGPAAASGSIVVNTPGGASNSVPFTVRSGNIYFVSTFGSDGANGGFASPWKTVLQARNSMVAGDTTYLENGVAQTTDDGSGWSTCLLLGPDVFTASGTAVAPIAMLAYPGATATIGNVSAPDSGIRADIGINYWVFAGLVLRGQNEAITPYGDTGWRIVGNDMSCPNGDGQSGCFEGNLFSNAKFYGNNVHDTGTAGASDQYQGVYFSTDSNHLEIGWNTISNVQGCRGIQIHSSPLGGNTGYNQYDIRIHDNLIHDTQCDGIVLATVDPSQGAVQVYNNIIYNAGKGPATPEGGGNFACVYAPGYTNNGPAGGGVVQVFNNTMYDCGAMKQPGGSSAIANGGNNPNLSIQAVDNIIDQPAGQPYIVSWTGNGYSTSNGGIAIAGSNNLFFGNGSAPAGFSLSLNADPQFVDTANYDFHLLAGSPARNAGISMGLATDFDGNARGGIYDLGALSFQAAGVASIRCDPPAMFASTSSVCVLSLTAAAPSGGTQVSLASDNTALTLPASVSVPAGSSDASVTLTSGAVLARTVATITATLAGGSGSFAQPLWLLPQGDASPLLLAVVDAASYQTDPLSPGGIVTIFGMNLGPAQGAGATDNNSVPVTLAGSKVLVGGTAAPLLYVQANQINAVIPYGIPMDSVQVQVEVNETASNSLTLAVAPAAPAVFTVSVSGSGPAVVMNQDGSLNSPSNPAARKSVITFYAEGLGQTDPPGVDGQIAGSTPPKAVASVAVTIGGIDAQVQSAGGAPGAFAGLSQVVVSVPANAPSGAAIPLALTVGGVPCSGAVTLAIQ
jgi:uncharacterized protein (TIGR03437 family)